MKAPHFAHAQPSAGPDPKIEIERLRLVLLNRGSLLFAALCLLALAAWILVPSERQGWPSPGTFAIAGMVLASALWRSGPFRARAILLVLAFFAGQLECLFRLGYVVDTAVVGLSGFVVAGLLLGVRGGIIAWIASTSVMMAGIALIGMGFFGSVFDPVAVDPSELRTGVRFALIYGGLSGVLAIGVWAMSSRLSQSLAENYEALSKILALQSAQKEIEEARESDEQQWRSLVANVADLIFNVNRDYQIEFMNRLPAGIGRKILGQRADSYVDEEYQPLVRDAIDRVFATGEHVEYDVPTRVQGEPPIWFTTRVAPILRDGEVQGATVIATDITERRNLEEQLRQSQKLEAIGQLTGGVAHDFNNLLTIILGNLELATDELPREDPTRELMDSATEAAERGAALTHRLLAFSRKQALRPRAVDLGQLLGDMRDLLSRTLGETVRVELAPVGDPWLCEADPAQLEAAILNLAINARDAMPGGGVLTIGTSNATFDRPHVIGHEEIAPGDYVMIAVSDTGAGMTPEVVQLAFDPFFTTKEIGRGTGLGLSSVYGFVRQSHGHVGIESRAGEGTTVRIHLPRAEGVGAAQTAVANEPSHAPDNFHEPRGNGELVLVVEDDDHVRPLTVRLLSNLGYRTVEAGHATAALDRLDEFPEIALLFTDVVLPGGSSGADLARVVQKRRPELPVLFTSGYTEAELSQHGRLDSGVALIEKPFGRAALARTLRMALEPKEPKEPA